MASSRSPAQTEPVTATLVLSVDVDAPVQQTWEAVVDWPGQGQWMVGTRVQGGQGEGATLEARTGVGRLSFLDTMVIERWDPPRLCHVRHTGRVVRGTGTFEVLPRPGGSTFVWREDLELPLGLLGRAGWPLARPLVAWGVRISLRRFARWVVSGRRTPGAAWPGTT